MNDFGLISVLPPGIYLSLILIQVSFLYTLTRSSIRTEWLILNFLILIFILTSLTLPIREVPRFAVTWRHVGIVDYIMRLGKVDPRIDAYFNWPIFFVIGALLTQAAGLKSILPLVEWAPIVYNLLYLPPLLALFDIATQERRQAWLAVWLFFLFNWVGQDYFSPQGLNLFLYMVFLMVILRWFGKTQVENHPIPSFSRLGRLASFARLVMAWFVAPRQKPEPITKRQYWALLTILILIFTFMVSSHQLTPLALIPGIFLLGLFNRLQPRLLPVIMIITVVIWLAIPANAFIKGRIVGLIDDIGQLDSAVSASVTDRLVGSPGHAIVVRFRLIYTLFSWVLGFAGGLVRYRKGYKDTDFALLAVAPFLLLAVLLYGGEMLMRVYLFSLPFMSFFASSLLWQVIKPDKAIWRTTILGIILIGLSAIFFLVRYGNESMDQYNQNELDAVGYVYSVAEPGSLISGPAKSLPFKYRDYEKYHSLFFEVETVSGDIQAIIDRMSDPVYPEAYLILNRSQAANLYMFYSFATTDWENFIEKLKSSDRFRLVFENEDSQVFILVKP